MNQNDHERNYHESEAPNAGPSAGVSGRGGLSEPYRRGPWRPKKRPAPAPASPALARSLGRASGRARWAHEHGERPDVHSRMAPNEQALFVARLGEAMRRDRTTHTRLGRACGLSRSTIGTYLTGVATPKVGALTRLAAALGCSADWLAGCSDDPAWQREPTPPKAPKVKPPREPKPTDSVAGDARRCAVFALRLREAMVRAGVTCRALGAALAASRGMRSTKAGLSTVLRYRTGRNAATRAGVADLAEALGCSAAWLRLETDEPGWLGPPSGADRRVIGTERRVTERLLAAAEGK